MPVSVTSCMPEVSRSIHRANLPMPAALLGTQVVPVPPRPTWPFRVVAMPASPQARPAVQTRWRVRVAGGGAEGGAG